MAGTGARQPDGILLFPADGAARLRRRRRAALRTIPVEIYIACWEWGKYLGEEALAEGVDVCVSSWTRIAPNTLPALAKAGANYMNSQLIRMEAHTNGYAEGIALDASGYVSEGSGENIFVVRDGKILTPPLGASVLPGITRDTRDRSWPQSLGIPVVETIIPREMLYIADEVFFSGTAAEITPIRSVDRIDSRQGHARPGDREAAKGVLRHRQWRRAGSLRLAHAYRENVPWRLRSVPLTAKNESPMTV